MNQHITQSRARNNHFVRLLLAIPLLISAVCAQQQATGVVPTLVNFSGTLTDVNNKPLTALTGVTFCLYKDAEGGSPLWLETQNIQPDRVGHYTVVLGATKSAGMPAELFVSGAARWLGVQAQEQAEQPRVMLLAVPYALKAGDAQTVGGLPASAFVLAPAAASGGNSPSSALSSDAGAGVPVGGSGSAGFLAAWTDNNGDLGNSVLFQSGIGSSAKIGINEKSPLATLDVNGSGFMRGYLEMATTGLATAAKGFSSNQFNLESSAYNSGTKKYSLQHFVWQSEPVGNNTTNPSATLNLLFGTDPNSPAETGLMLSSSGLFTFASGQTFPGTGTITGVTTANGSGLIGGGTSGILNLGLTNSCAANQVLQWNGSKWVCATMGGGGTITGVTAGTDLTGGGTSGNVTLNLDTSRVPQLNVSNSFNGNQTITANGGNEALNVTQEATGGQTYGIIGTSFSTGNRAAAILGQSLAGSGIVFGVEGYIADNDGAGVFGADGNPLSQTGGSLTGFGSGIWGDGSSSGVGVLGTVDDGTAVVAENNSGDSSAFFALDSSTQGLAWGSYALSESPIGVGALGAGAQFSNTYFAHVGSQPFGVIGDAGDNANSPNAPIGVWGAADSGYAVLGENASPLVPAGAFLNLIDQLGLPAFEAGSDLGVCTIDTGGNQSCDGNLSSFASLPDNRVVQLYAVQSPENWFEDFGSGELLNGSTVISFERTFAQTVNPGVDYHVFITPNGDSRGLYVSHKTSTSFEVHEQGGGRSSIAFDYRIVALRKGYENVRMADVTESHGKLVAARHTLTTPTNSKTKPQVRTPAMPRRRAVSRQKGLVAVSSALNATRTVVP